LHWKLMPNCWSNNLFIEKISDVIISSKFLHIIKGM